MSKKRSSLAPLSISRGRKKSVRGKKASLVVIDISINQKSLFRKQTMKAAKTKEGNTINFYICLDTQVSNFLAARPKTTEKK